MKLWEWLSFPSYILRLLYFVQIHNHLKKKMCCRGLKSLTLGEWASCVNSCVASGSREGIIPLCLFRSCEKASRVLCPALGCLVQERHWHSLASPVEDHQDCYGAEACDIQRVWEILVCSVLREGKGESLLFSQLLLWRPWRERMEPGFSQECMRGNNHKLKCGKFWLDIRIEMFNMMFANCWDRIPERLWNVQSSEIFGSLLDKSLGSLP